MSYNLYYASGAVYAVIEEKVKRYFYEDGSVKTVEMYENNRLHGDVSLYWPNGVMKRKMHFVHGVRCGVDTIWHQNGQMIDTGMYAQGRTVGIHQRWSAEGLLIEKIEFLDAKRWNVEQWDEMGQLRTRAIWLDEHNYEETCWDHFQKKWVEKKGRWDGTKLVYC